MFNKSAVRMAYLGLIASFALPASMAASWSCGTATWYTKNTLARGTAKPIRTWRRSAMRSPAVPHDQFHDGPVGGDDAVRRLLEMVVAAVVQ